MNSPRPPSEMPLIPWRTSTLDDAESLLRMLESAPAVLRRTQFFLWTQNRLSALLPHRLLVCGAWQRHRRHLVFDVFHSVLIPTPLHESFTDGQSPLLQSLIRAWLAQGRRPLTADLAWLESAGLQADAQALSASGIQQLRVHGVVRPFRPDEVESFFIVGMSSAGEDDSWAQVIDVVMPTLHACWQRVAVQEAHPGFHVASPAMAPGGAAPAGRNGLVMTDREIEILRRVRAGCRNKEIGEQLGISPLTVKNHLQKILRKLGASNRAQAVAEAIALGLVERRPEAN